MFDLFRWGFMLSLTSMWAALGAGVLMLFIPGKALVRESTVLRDDKRAA